MAAVQRQITQAEITSLTGNITVNVTTNRPGSGHLRKLQKIQQILKKSAESQLLVAAYYNQLIQETQTNPNLYNDAVDYSTYTVSVNTGASKIDLTPQAVGSIDNNAFDTIPLVISYKEQVQRINTEITNALAPGGIIDDGNTYDGGRPSLLLKSKKKKNKKISRRG